MLLAKRDSLSKSSKRSDTARRLSGILSVLSAVLIFTQQVAGVQMRKAGGPNNAMRQSGGVERLDAGKSRERVIARGQSHTYQITLTAGQFLHVAVSQMGVDIIVTALGPDNRVIAEIDSPNGTRGLEQLLVVPEADGVYRVKISSSNQSPLPGRYQTLVKKFPAATARDRTRFAAQNICSRAAHTARAAGPEPIRKAIEEYREALKLWEDADDLQAEAYTLVNMGMCHASLRESEQAIACYKKALTHLQSAGDPPGEVFAITALANVYYSTSYTRALDHYNQALPRWREIGDRDSEAFVLTRLGAIYNFTGKKHEALDYYNQALLIVAETQDPSGQLYLLTSIGLIYNFLGYMQHAIEYHSRAISIIEKMNDPGTHARLLSNLAGVYIGMGEGQKALQIYKQALEHHLKSTDEEGIVRTLNNLAFTFHTLGDRQSALEHYNKALELCQTAGDAHAKASLLNNIGRLYFDMGDMAKALEFYEKAIPIAQSENGVIYSRVISSMGKLYEARGDKEKALECFHKSLSIRRSLHNRGGELITLYDIASLERDRGNLEGAREMIERALEIIESLRIKITADELRASYLASRQDYFEFYIDLLMRMHKKAPSAGYDAEALQVSERARARTLLETLGEAQFNIRQGVDQALIKRERELQELLNAGAVEQLRATSKRQQEAAGARIDKLIAEYQEVRAHIRDHSPHYAALTRPARLSLTEVRQQLLDPDTLLIEYALGNKHSYLWVVSQNSLNTFELPGRAEIEGAASRVYELLTKSKGELAAGGGPSGARLAEAERQYWEAARRLSQMVLGPAASLLGSKRLLIVTEGALQYVPFAALPSPRASQSEPATNDNAPTPLIAEHEIVKLPSAYTLATMRRELDGRTPSPKQIAILADPVFDRDDTRLSPAARKRALMLASKAEKQGPNDEAATRKSSPGLKAAFGETRLIDETGHIPRLIFSRQEARAISGLVPSNESKLAFDFDASRATVVSPELSKYRIIHFATHGVLNSEHPELSGIVLSLIDRRGNKQNGFLRLHDIYNLRLPAELVVLSACQTGLGKDIKGEGLTGLTRGFMYAGAARIIASLWRVDDKATADLMAYFYQAKLSKDRPSAAAALRSAQLSMWKDRRWRAPYNWAGFILQGEWR